MWKTLISGSQQVMGLSRGFGVCDPNIYLATIVDLERSVASCRRRANQASAKCTAFFSDTHLPRWNSNFPSQLFFSVINYLLETKGKNRQGTSLYKRCTTADDSKAYPRENN